MSRQRNKVFYTVIEFISSINSILTLETRQRHGKYYSQITLQPMQGSDKAPDILWISKRSDFMIEASLEGLIKFVTLKHSW